MTRSLNQPKVNMNRQVLPVSRGGTGSNTPATAVSTLQVVANSQKGQPNGPIALDAQGQMNSANAGIGSVVSLGGSSDVVKGVATTFEITDYDSSKTYNVSVSAGSINRVGNTLYYTPPATNQLATLTVNGKVFNLNIVSTAPNKPTISGIAGGGIGSAIVGYLSSSAYSITGTADTHASSDWQIATDAAFNNIVVQTASDAVNKLGWTGSGLAPLSSYFARVRHRSSDGGISPWSDAASFTTAASYTTLIESSKLVASDRASTDFFGVALAISGDSNRVVVGAEQADHTSVTNPGAAYVFVRTGTTWTQEAKLVASDPAASNFLGRSVSMNSDGTRCVIGASGNNSGATNKGAAYVFVRNTTTNVWTQEQKLVASDGAASDFLGDYGAVTIDSAGNRIAVAARMSDPSATSNAGAVYVFARSGSTWTQEAKIIAPTLLANAYFGFSIDMSSDGSLIVIGSPGMTVAEPGFGEQLYTTPGTYIFTVPAGVTSLSMVAVGGGGASTTSTGGGGAGLAYKNNFPVTPGQQFTVVVGQAGQTSGQSGSASSITKIGGGLTINAPGGSGSGSASGTPTGGDVNAVGSQGSYTTTGNNGTTGWSYMGGGGIPTYNSGNTPGASAVPASGGSAGPGSFLSGGIRYTVYQNNNSNYYVYLDGSNGSGTAYGGGGSVYFAGQGTDTESYGWNSGFGGGVRFVWGTGKTYPTSAKTSTLQGAAYVAKRTGTSWAIDATILPNVLTSSAFFGGAVSISGDGTRIAVTERDVVVGSGNGQVHVFRNSGTWALEQTLTGTGRTTSDTMGISVSLNDDGSVLAIGEYQTNDTFNSVSGQYGSVYQYTRNGTTWTQGTKLLASDRVVNGKFGRSVDISGDGLQILAGGYQMQAGGVTTGAVYALRR